MEKGPIDAPSRAGALLRARTSSSRSSRSTIRRWREGGSAGRHAAPKPRPPAPATHATSLSRLARHSLKTLPPASATSNSRLPARHHKPPPSRRSLSHNPALPPSSSWPPTNPRPPACHHTTCPPTSRLQTPPLPLAHSSPQTPPAHPPRPPSPCTPTRLPMSKNPPFPSPTTQQGKELTLRSLCSTSRPLNCVNPREHRESSPEVPGGLNCDTVTVVKEKLLDSPCGQGRPYPNAQGWGHGTCEPGRAQQ